MPSAAARSAISQAAAAAASADPDLDGVHVERELPAGGFDVTGALEEGGECPVGEDVELGAGNCTVEESLIVKVCYSLCVVMNAMCLSIVLCQWCVCRIR